MRSLLAVAVVLFVACPGPTGGMDGGEGGGTSGTGGGRAGGSAAGGRAVTPAKLTIDQATGAFGNVAVGDTSNAIVFVITNTGGDYTGALEVVLEGDRFALGVNTCTNDSLFADAACEVRVTFAPTAVMGSVGKLTVRGAPGGEVVAQLTGTGTAPTSSTLTVNRTGTGMGTITGGTINCGAVCSERGAINRSVTLTATPIPGAMFGGWTGCDSATGNTCQVTVASNRTVVASFTGAATPMATLTVTKIGTGSGSVAGTGITCGADCTETVALNSSITLTATPAGNAVFAGFVGCDTVTATTCTVRLTGSRTVTATFDISQSAYTLTVAKDGSGMGTITGTGINCGTDCNESVPAGQTRTVVAAPAAGSVLSGWAGCDSVAALDCIVTVGANRTVTATFSGMAVPPAPSNLTAAITVTGAVELAWMDNSASETDFRIDRSDMPATGFAEIAQVAANATTASIPGLMPGTHYFRVRANGLGGSSPASNVAVLTIAPTSWTLSVSKTGMGSGTVASTPAGITCGADCSEPYPSGSMVTLTATPANGSTFSSWSGCTTSSGTSCTVSLTANRTVGATFAAIPSSLVLSVPPSSATGTYNVSWTCGTMACPASFILEEDGMGTFTAPTSYPVNGSASYGFTAKPDGRYCYRVKATGPYSNTACVSVARPGTSGVLHIQNASHYDIVDLRLNTVQYTNSPAVVPPGQYFERVMPTTSVAYEIGIGFWNGTTRDVWFVYSGTTGVIAGQTTNISIDNPTIEQIMTNFGNYSEFEGAYFDNSVLHTRRYRFNSSGAYQQYDDQVMGIMGTYQLDAWPNYATTISFKFCNPVCGTPVQIPFSFSQFTMQNGPAAAPRIDYYRLP
jgi:hypothetical protein